MAYSDAYRKVARTKRTDAFLAGKIAELTPLVGQENAVRVSGLGERGLRWKICRIDEAKKKAVVIASGKTPRTVDVRKLTVAPIQTSA